MAAGDTPEECLNELEARRKQQESAFILAASLRQRRSYGSGTKIKLRASQLSGLDYSVREKNESHRVGLRLGSVNKDVKERGEHWLFF